MKSNFFAYSSYYDLLYADKNYALEAEYISNVLNRLDNQAKDILEYGCGTGGHAAFLCNKGFKVTGLEKSEEMVKIALEKEIKGFTPLVRDISAFELDREYDAAMALFHVISYLTRNEDLVSCFAKTNRHLKQDGFFIFDAWYAPAVYSQKPEVKLKRLENEKAEVWRLAEPVWHFARNVIEVNYEIIVRNKQTSVTDKFSETHPMRYFSIPEIELLAGKTGFKLVNAEEFLTARTPGVDTWGVCFILQKIQSV